MGLNIKPDRCKLGRILQRIGYQEVDNGLAYEPIVRCVFHCFVLSLDAWRYSGCFTNRLT